MLRLIAAWRFAMSRSMWARTRPRVYRESVQKVGVIDLGSRIVGNADFVQRSGPLFTIACRCERFFRRSARGLPPSSAWATCAASVLESWKKTCVPTEKIAARISAGTDQETGWPKQPRTPNLRASDKYGFDSAAIGDEVLDLVAVEGEERLSSCG